MKKIIVCCDGTGNEYSDHNTNVVLFYDAVIKGGNQATFYDPGVGTGGWVYNEESGAFNAKSDQATGGGLQKNVEDAYCFLMDTWEPGDKVYLLGFSRGAFTVRSLAGMLHLVGMLERDNDNLVEYASNIYNDKKRHGVAAGFKRTFSRPCPVHFIGVWDTVASLKLNAGKKFHDHKLKEEVTFGYHALSIDEKRKDFQPSLWNKWRIEGQTIEQVWFAGVHSDVGGWYTARGLSNIALQWMAKKAAACGLKLDKNRLAEYLGDPHGEIHQSYDGFWKFRGSRARDIPSGSMIHSSVVERMNNPRNKYKPQNLPRKYKVVD